MAKPIKLTILVICALALAAALSSNASAAGLTSFTCRFTDIDEIQFKDPHCKEVVVPGTQTTGYHHYEIHDRTTITTINGETAAGTTAAAPAILKGTLAGVATSIECTTVNGTGEEENSEAGGEMFITGTTTLVFSGCQVTAPAGKGCKITGGEITTSTLSGTTKGQGDAVNVTPLEGTQLASVKIEGCSISALNNTFAVTGSLKVPALTGATSTTLESEVTTAGTFKFGGQKAGLEMSVTRRGHKQNNELTSPVVQTTFG